MVVHNLKNKAEFDEAKADGSLMIVDAYATWCGPCKVIAPKLVEYSEADHKDVRFYKVDVDEVPDVAKELGIRAMPTFVLFKEGAEVETIVGANPKAIEAALAKHKA